MKLTQRRVDGMTTPGRYADDGAPTLHLLIGRDGTKAWVQRLVIASRDGSPGRRVDRGLGPTKAVPLTKAREIAFDNRRLARQGIDPRPTVKDTAPTLAEVLDKMEKDDRGVEKGKGLRDSTKQARATYLRYADALMSMPIDTIGRVDVLSILRPIWIDRHATAVKLRGILRRALGWGQGHGYIEVNWAGDAIEGALPAVNNGTDHQAAVDYKDVPGVYQGIKGDGDVARCMRLVILTACRSGEAMSAKWDDIDLDARTWTIPASDSKVGKGHVVPLTDDAVAQLGTPGKGLVFRGRSGAELSKGAMRAALRKVCPKCTMHGFRSTFRTWVQDATDHPRVIAEHALGHAVGSGVERSYARGTMLDKRRVLMDDWTDYVNSK
ncbi:MAG: tyrosine-type recombinase/integrase [Acidobacteria bacterium]|nr:tyrosine-type recombinase/integrase [Acidobacteriota bacterium]